MNVVITSYNSTEDMNIKLQELKGKTKLKIKSNFYGEMNIKNFKFEQDPFSKNAQGISKTYHELSLLGKGLQNRPQVKIMNNKYYDLYYTVTKNRKEKDNKEEQRKCKR